MGLATRATCFSSPWNPRLTIHTSPPKGGLVYWLRRVLHDYSDKLAVEILKRVVQAMADDSRVLIAEDVAANPPHFMTAIMDLMIYLHLHSGVMEDCSAPLRRSQLSAISARWLESMSLEMHSHSL